MAACPKLAGLSLFAGTGMLDEGVRAGFDYLGFDYRCVGYVERDAYAAATLVARMEGQALDQAPVWDDITTFNGRAWSGVVDCIAAGFPCQDISVAGRRAGLDGARSGLFFRVLDVADDCGAWCLFLENVAGIASATATVVDETEGELFERAAARVVGELADRGWDAEWMHLRASGGEWLTPNVPNGGRSVPEETVLAKGMTETGKRTVGIESQVRFWTTPQAHDVTERGSGQQPTSKAGNACLARDARLWPTASSRDGDSRRCPTKPDSVAWERKKARGAVNAAGLPSDDLSSAASMWPTPHGFQAGNGPDGNEFSTAIRNWTTPKSSDGAKGGPNMRGTRGDTPLPNMAANWASPTARIVKGGGAR